MLSRFLPYTVHFDVPKLDSRPANPPRADAGQSSGKGNGVTLSLFNQGINGPARQESLVISKEHEDFFLSKQLQSQSSKTADSNTPYLIAPSEPHSPTWGKGIFSQPKSRALNPPSSSILKHAKIRETIAEIGRLGTRTDTVGISQEDHSHDKAFVSADWSIQPAEQGNGGLRNAVRAAVESGALREKTWVSYTVCFP